MKVLTTYSALLELGTDFRWPTKIYYTGRFHKGIIHGDLVVEAFGDPTLSTKDLYRISKRLRRLGVHKITGNMILDRSFFATADRVSSGFDRNRYSEYNAMPDAAMLNDHLSKTLVGPKNGTIVVTKAIPGDRYNIINRIKPTAALCRGKNSWPYVSVTHTGSGTPQVVFSGTISTHCPRRSIYKLLTHAHDSFFYALKYALGKAGISFGGKLVLSRVPKSAKALIVHHARPLLQIISKTNKKSNNLYARHIFLLTGAQREGAPATEAKGAKAVREILSSRGLWDDRIKVNNGCGLARNSKLTANVLVNVLEDAYKHYGKRWLNALSVAGIDGTIKRRFRHSVAKGRAWMKTGTLNNAKNIAGFVRGKSGKMYVLAVLYNGREHWKGSTLQNQIIEWLARH
jgi:D-alanyl-D-alanine carboxypeptidase/D-alanyl-D-alanine-endopeptidase (penicillin-binding protein 4)